MFGIPKRRLQSPVPTVEVAFKIKAMSGVGYFSFLNLSGNSKKQRLETTKTAKENPHKALEVTFRAFQS